MKTLMKFRNVLLLITSMLLLTSCSSIMLVGDDTLQSIESIGDFFKVYFILQLSIYICSLIFTFIPLGGRTTSIIIHFIWVVSERDYGFFKVMLLFSLFTNIRYLSALSSKYRKSIVIISFSPLVV